jgi:hypothetical protein
MVLARIVQAPLTYPRVQGDIRRALVRRFPYAIYYHAMSDEIVVLGVTWSTAPSTLAVAALTSNFAVEQTAARIRSLAAAHRGVRPIVIFNRDDGVSRESKVSEDPVGFLQDRGHRGQIPGIDHVSMCLAGRFISRVVIPAAVDTYQLV